MRLLLAALAVSTVLLSSCATGKTEVALFPIEDTDIYFDGENICMSPWYFNEILQAKIK